MAERQEKIEARKRGADLRNVSVSPLQIQTEATTPKTPKPKMLESVMVRDEDMNLPRFRRSTLSPNRSVVQGGVGGDEGSEGSETEEEQGSERGEQVVSSLRDNEQDAVSDEQDVDYGQNMDDGVDDGMGVGGETPVDTPVSSESPGTQSRSETPAELTQVKRKRGRPRKEKTVEVPTGPKRKRGRPKKGEEVVTERIAVDLSEGSIATRRRRRNASEPPSAAAGSSGPPISLTTRRSGVQKPLIIDVERLVTDSNRDKRYKLNTIDVLQDLIRRYEPVSVGFEAINEERVQGDFKTHILDYLSHLSDVHGTIYDLNYEISRVRKAKDDMRESIFSIRKDYKRVSDELNGLRSDYRQSQEKYEQVMSLTTALKEIRNEIRNKDPKGDVVQDINKNVGVLGKLFNPVIGLNRNIVRTNKVLSKVDESMD